jgi:hypothetical protein
MACLLGSTAPNAVAEGVGPNQAYYLVKDFQDDWQVYDERYQNYIPYLRERHQNYKSFSIFLDFDAYRSYQLLYYATKDNYLFINASLQKKLPAKAWVVINLDSLHRVYPNRELFVTFYSALPGLEDKTLFVGNAITQTQRPIEIAEAQITAKPRTVSSFQDFFSLAGLLLLGFFAFLYNFQVKSFHKYYNLRDLLTIGKRSDTGLQSTGLDIGSILFIFNLSLIIAYLYLFVISKNVEVFGSRQLVEYTDSLGGLLLTYLQVTLSIFFLFGAKYFCLYLLGSLYRLNKITNFHFFKIIQASGLFFMTLLSILLLFYYTKPSLSETVANTLTGVVAAFFILRLLLLYFTINKLASLKNLYLFSYLCIVELIPLIVGIRFAL